MPANDDLIKALIEMGAVTAQEAGLTTVVDANPQPTSQPPITDEPPSGAGPRFPDDPYAQRLDQEFSFWARTGINPWIPALPPDRMIKELEFAAETGMDPWLPALPAGFDPDLGYSVFPGYQKVMEQMAFTPPPQGGGPGGPPPAKPKGPGAPAPITWSPLDVNVAGAPEWWKGLTPSQWTPETEYITLANMMLPFLSPQDQQSLATNLFQFSPEFFGHLDPESLNIPPPTEMDNMLKSKFLGAGRAEDALFALQNMVASTGRKEADFGPGLNYLRSLADVFSDFGGAGGGLPTRTERLNIKSALDPLLAQGKSGALAAFGPLGQAFTQPFFSAGQVDPIMKLMSGQGIFGAPNPAFF